MPLLPLDALANRCDPALLGAAPAAQPDPSAAPSMPTLVGHQRARRAIDLALAVESDGYNLFVMGHPGIGKSHFVGDAIRRRGKRCEPLDWVYLNNFDTPSKPLALGLAQGLGRGLRDDMRRLVDELRATIPAAFEADTYTTELERIQSEIAEKQTHALTELNEEAGHDDIALIQTPNGFTLAPVAKGEVIEPEAFAQLPKERQQQIQERLLALQEKLQRIMRGAMRLRKEQIERVRKLNRETTALAVGAAIDELLERYRGQARILDWLGAVHNDILENADDFLRSDKTEAAPATHSPFANAPDLGRYEVNLLSTQTDGQSAPVVSLEHPTLANLIGRIEHQAQFGTLLTDFRMIRPGELHRANGGYLLVDAQKLLAEPYAWPGLKRALGRRSIRIESIAEMVGAISTVQLEPEPIPLDVKVVMFGDRHLYYALDAYDPDFGRLFRIVADFDDDLSRDAQNLPAIARVIEEQACDRRLLPLSRAALARLIDHGARLADDAQRISARLQRLIDLAVEADVHARSAARREIGADDIAQAERDRRDRAARSSEHYRRSIIEGTLAIDTTGARVGQINALAVYEMSDELFGHPSRITATNALGEGRVIDIQRETDMGGAIHSKGVLILSAYLNARYSAREPLALSASLVFEQSYGPIDGDSATIAEICALLSAIADVPILQSLAVTGSMNQLGDVQAIGGVNEKIEGFFEICRDRGLDGSHGVIIPAANVRHLMLSDEVIDAVAQHRFAIHSVAHVDEAITLLTGMPAGDPVTGTADRHFNARVVARLHALSSLRRGLRPGRPARNRYGSAGKHD